MKLKFQEPGYGKLFILLAFCLLVQVKSASGQETLYQAYQKSANKAFEEKKWSVAAKDYRKAANAAINAWSNSDMRTINSWYNVGASNYNQKEYEQAHQFYTKAYQAIYKKSDRKSRDMTLLLSLQLAKCHVFNGKPEKALRYLEWGIPEQKKFDSSSKRNNDFKEILAKANQKLGNHEETIAFHTQRVDNLAGQGKSAKSELKSARWDLATALKVAERFEEAEKIYRLLIKNEEKSLVPERKDVGHFWFNIMKMRKSQDDREGAIAAGQKAMKNYDRSIEDVHDISITTLRDLANLHYNKSEYEKGDTFHLDALSKKESELGKSHVSVASTLESLGWSLNRQKKFADAETRLNRAISIREREEKNSETHLLYPLKLLASALINQEKNSAAETTWKRVLTIYKEEGNEQQIANTAEELASLYDRMKQPDLAQQILEDTYREREKFLGSKNPKLAAMLSTIGSFYWRTGQHDKAEDALRLAIKRHEQASGENSEQVADSMVTIAKFLNSLSRYKEAKSFAQKVLRIRESGKASAGKLAIARDLLGWCFVHLQQDNGIAMDLAKQNFDYYKNKNDESGLAWSSVLYGITLKKAKEYSESANVLELGLSIDRRHQKTESMSVALANLADVYARLGDKRKETSARRDSLQLDLSEPITGTSLVERLRRYRNRAINYLELADLEDGFGDFAKSSELYHKALECVEQNLSPKHDLVVLAINRLAWEAGRKGDLDEVAKLYNKSSEILRQLDHEDSPKAAWQKRLLAGLSLYRGDLKTAESLLAESKKIIDNGEYDETGYKYSMMKLDLAKGNWSQVETWAKKRISFYNSIRENHLYTSGAYEVLASTFLKRGEFDKAEKAATKSIELYNSAYGEKNYQCIDPLMVLADIALEKGEKKKAIELVRSVQEIVKSTYPDNDFQFASVMAQQARWFRINDDWSEAEKRSRAVLSIYRDALGSEHPVTLHAQYELARTLHGAGKFGEAMDLVSHVIKHRKKIYDDKHYSLVMPMILAGRINQETGKQDVAVSNMQKAVEIATICFGKEGYRTIACRTEYAAFMARQGQIGASTSNGISVDAKIKESELVLKD